MFYLKQFSFLIKKEKWLSAYFILSSILLVNVFTHFYSIRSLFISFLNIQEKHPYVIIVADNSEIIDHVVRKVKKRPVVKFIERKHQLVNQILKDDLNVRSNEDLFYVKIFFQIFSREKDLINTVEELKKYYKDHQVTFGEIKNLSFLDESSKNSWITLDYFVKLILFFNWIISFFIFVSKISQLSSVMNFFHRRKMVSLKSLLVGNMFIWFISMIMAVSWVPFSEGVNFSFLFISLIVFFLIPFTQLKRNYE
jgi:hypothetical protein